MLFKKYITILFLFVLFIPVLDKVFNVSDKVFKFNSNEKRALAKMPQPKFSNLDTFPKLCEDYLNDHFMCRNFLIGQYNAMLVKLFKQSPVPNKVFIGIDDWLYLNNYDYNTSHKVDLSERQLTDFLEEFKRRRDFLKQQNCALYVYIIPSKRKVYPEYAGNRVPIDPDQGAQLEAYIKKNSDLSVTYLLPTFLNEKRTDAPFLYYKTDNHWTDYGAFLAYQKIMEDLKNEFPDLKPLTPDDLISKDEIASGGNTAQMMGAESYYTEHQHHLEVAKKQAIPGERKNYAFTGDFDKTQFEKQFDTENKELPSALFIRDSFGDALFPFLSQSFSHSTFIFDLWRYQLNEEIVKREKPKVLVYLITEPLLLNLLKNSR
jgi:alginate O-acetyltransferase complex protein AlgJ